MEEATPPEAGADSLSLSLSLPSPFHVRVVQWRAYTGVLKDSEAKDFYSLLVSLFDDGLIRH